MRQDAYTCDATDLCAGFLERVRDTLKVTGASVPADGEGFCDMPRSCGPTVWGVLHGVAAAMRDEVCAHCGEEAVKLVSGMHDLVNVKLGKPLHDAANFKAVAGKYATAGTGSNEVQKMMQNFDVSTLPRDHEVGAPICQMPSGVELGAWSHGSNDHAVDIPMQCGAGIPIGTMHTHPGGEVEPSGQDMA